MDNFQKYSRLMLLLAAGFVGFIVLLALLLFILRIFSVTMFHIPGFDLFFQYVIIIIPYLLFLAAYYYLFRRIRFSQSRASRIISRILMLAGIIAWLFTLTLSTALFLEIKSPWLRRFEDYTHYALFVQLVILFIAAGVLASGDRKEKDWMQRGT